MARKTTPRNRQRRPFGSIRQLPSGRFQARYTDASGTDHTAPTTFATRTAADQWLATERADHLRGLWRSPDHGNETVAEYINRWIDQRTDLAPATRFQYRNTLRRWIDRDLTLPATRGRKPIRVNLGERPLKSLTVGTIREWYAAAHATQSQEAADRALRGLRWKPGHRTPTAYARAWARGQGITVPDAGRLSPRLVTAWQTAGSPGLPEASTVDLSGKPADVVVSAYRTLRAALNAALDDGLITANPCRIRGAGVSHPTTRPIATPEEVQALAAAMPEHFAAAVDLAAWSALRAGELFALTRRHVDLDAATITVERAMIDVPGEPLRFGPPKTPSSLRTVHLPPSVVTRLRLHMSQHTPDDPDALIFAHPDGSPLSRDRRTQLFDRARRTVGRPELRWHDLRHTGATLAARAGASVRELQARLGHATYDAAMRYQHADAQRDRELAQRLDTYAATPTIAPVLTLNGTDR